MQQYYTLEQAAQILRTSPDQLKEMARNKQIRAFQDRSGWRFRAQEIDELARERGLGSDPELPLGDAVKAAEAGGKEVFNFSLEADDSDEVPLGKNPADSGKHGPRSPGSARKSGSKSPPPKASSDSDVRLVMDRGDMDFPVASESKAPASKPPVSPVPKKGGSSKSHPGPTIKEDSGVRIVPLDQASDSDVKVVPASPHDSTVSTVGQSVKKSSDSDIRIEEIHKGGPRDQIVTEEIDLDAEQRKAEAAPKGRKVTQHKPKTQAGAPLPTSSPFELSESDVNLKKQAGPRAPEEAKADTDSSSDFELKPMTDSSPLELGSDEDLPQVKGDDEVNLGEVRGAAGDSGISLQDPADSGISLEQGSSDEFELSIDPSVHSPQPAAAPSDSDSDSSSDFELGVQGEGDSSPTDEGSSSSEFELSLDAAEGSSDLALEQPASDSDSEFELTLDDSGGLSVEESSSEESDVLETDFEAPAMDEESGSEAVALDEADTDLESSEFDLALESGDESGSQVVPLEDEEEADAGSATVQRKAVGRRTAEESEEGLEDIGEALDEDLEAAPEVEEDAETVAAAPQAPAEWGVVTPVAALFCTIVLFFVSLMSFELMRGMWGYHRGVKASNTLIHPIAKMFSGDDKLPDE